MKYYLFLLCIIYLYVYTSSRTIFDISIDVEIEEPSTYKATPFKDCGSTAKLINTNVSGCNSPPCILKKGQPYQINITFISDAHYDAIFNAVYAEIGRLTLPFAIPGDHPCNDTVCPLEAGKEYSMVTILTIPSHIPSVLGIIKWKIENAKNKIAFICSEIPFHDE